MNPADLFSHETNPVRLAPGETLFKAGDVPDGMYILLDGALEVIVESKVVENSVRGAIIGEMALIDQSPRGATVVAREPSSLAKLDAARFHRLIQQNPFFAMHVMKVLADRIRHLDRLLAQSKAAVSKD
jgi:CRP-like cAMP-binding protein